MNRFQTISTYSALLLGAFIITGCSSSDDDDGGGVSGGGTTTVPANAILIDTSATAEQTTVSAITTGTLIVSAFGVETSTILTGKDILNIAMDTVRNENRASPVSAIGVAFSEPCSGGGTVSGDETETATSYSATATFTNCIEGSLTLNGSFSVSSTFSETGSFSDNASGTLTVTIGSDSIGFNFVYAENGNENTGDYTVTTFNYVINPSAGGGYAVTLTQSLVGNTFLSCELASGQVLVTGASNSQARGTINPDRTLKVEYHNGDGSFIESDNSPLACPV